MWSYCITSQSGSSPRRRCSSDCCDQPFYQLIVRQTGASQRGPFGARRSIGPSFDLRIDHHVCSRTIDRLNLNCQRVATAGPRTSCGSWNVSVPAKLALRDNSTLRERVRLAYDNTVRQSGCSFIQHHFLIAHQLLNVVDDHVTSSTQSVGVWQRRSFRCAATAEIEPAARARVSLVAVVCGVSV